MVDRDHQFDGACVPVAHPGTCLAPDPLRDQAPVQGRGQRAWGGADDLGRVPVRHDGQDGAFAQDPRPGQGGLFDESFGLSQLAVDAAFRDGVPVAGQGDAADLEQVYLPPAVHAEFDVQRGAMADPFQFAREPQDGRDAVRADQVFRTFPVDVQALVDAVSAGHGVGASSFVIVVDAEVRRAVHHVVGHDHAADHDVAGHGLDQDLILGVASHGVHNLPDRRIQGVLVGSGHVQDAEKRAGHGGRGRVLRQGARSYRDGLSAEFLLECNQYPCRIGPPLLAGEMHRFTDDTRLDAASQAVQGFGLGAERESGIH
ncbi:hypothetical protein CDEN61S_04237 [Castellaniella denitrificans]